MHKNWVLDSHATNPRCNHLEFQMGNHMRNIKLKPWNIEYHKMSWSFFFVSAHFGSEIRTWNGQQQQQQKTAHFENLAFSMSTNNGAIVKLSYTIPLHLHSLYNNLHMHCVTIVLICCTERWPKTMKKKTINKIIRAANKCSSSAHNSNECAPHLCACFSLYVFFLLFIHLFVCAQINCADANSAKTNL